jgi:hypothetical protein
MSLRNVISWSIVGIFVIIPAIALARWRVIAARKLADRLVSDLRAKGERLSERDRKAFVAQLIISGWKTRALALRIQGVAIPDTYLQEWAGIVRRIKRLTLVWIIIGIVVWSALKTFIQFP